MSSFLDVIGFLGFTVFLIMAIVSAIRKTKKAKKWMIFAAGGFIIMLIGGAITPGAKETTGSAKVENRNESAKQKAADEVKKKAEVEAAAKKKAEEKAAAKKKAEEAAELKAEKETPLYKLRNAVINELGDNSNRNGKKITNLTIDQNGHILLRIKGEDNLTNNMIVDGVEMDLTNALKSIEHSKVKFKTVELIATFEMVDQYGNSKEEDVVDLLFNKSTADKINFDNFDFKNLYKIADDKNVQPSFAK